MKLTGTAIVSAVLLSVVSAQKPIVSMTSPLANTKYKACSDAILSWINPQERSISEIVLAYGPAEALQPVMTIAQNVPASDGHYTWKIPCDIKNGDKYAFKLGTSPKLAFAGPFTIEGGVGGNLPSGGSSGSPPTNNNGGSSSGTSTGSEGTSGGSSSSSSSDSQTNQTSASTHTSSASRSMTGSLALAGAMVLVATQIV
ncbi:hypothetical protein EC973_002730 [Apophysomyces ossiformis]|uniref:Yeast cell wall synthesis Kre9/Knh1-like N-terminal domain-containing protein n=1 Tax=Apophysomyces ossiformis TaxID=679940 RepID=A0A8H7BHY0_9FUNG|nr:hypothetical protein EC973_002730 [Apophysomyces ossiformis]